MSALWLAVPSVFAQLPFWTQTNGPEGGALISVAVSPRGDVVAKGFYAIVYSHDGGRTWQEGPWFPHLWSGQVAAATGGDFFLAVPWHGVFRSKERGVSWQNIYTLWDFPPSDKIVVGKGGDIYVATVVNGVLATSGDRGKTWRPIFIPGVETQVSALATDEPRTIVVGTDGQGVYLSTDGGSTWQPAGLAGTTILAVARDKWGNLYAALRAGQRLSDSDPCTGGVYRSSDAGVTWRYVAGCEWYQVESLVADRRGRIFALGSQARLHVSENRGETWRNLDLLLYSLTVAPDGSLLGGGPDGFYRSDDGGSTWTHHVAGLKLTDPRSLVATAQGIFTGVASLGLYRSRDGGRSWYKLLPVDVQIWVPDITAAPNGDLYFTGVGSMRRSKDGGETWETVEMGCPPNIDCVPGPVVFDQNGGVYVLLGHGVHPSELVYSGTGDPPWTPIPLPTGCHYPPRAVVGTAQEVYVDCGSSLWRSLDRGQSWTELLTYARADALFVTRRGTVLISAWVWDERFNAISLTLFRSVDHGQTWHRFEWSHNEAPLAFAEALRSPGMLFAMTPGGLRISEDDGATWVAVPVTHLEEGRLPRALAVGHDGHLYAGFFGGAVWRSVSPVE